MKSYNLVFGLLLTTPIFSQTVESSDIEVKLYLPTHLKNGIKPTDKLEVYLMPFPDETVKISGKVIAVKGKENTYSFKLPQIRFWHIGFKIGGYGDFKLCVNNRKGLAMENHDFNLHLLPFQPHFTKPAFLPPCMFKDEEEEE